MLLNYLKIALRSLVKHKGFTSINLLSLALGLTAGILIMIYVLDELSFDQFHTKVDRLYRITTAFNTADKGGSTETNGWPIGKILKNEFPEVESVLYSRTASYLLINHDGKRIRENPHFMTEEFFTMFSFPLLKGNPETALLEPYSVVLSETLAKKYFPDQDAFDKTLTMADTILFRVTGIMKDIPANSHIQASMFVSFSTYQKISSDFSFDGGWGNINMRNYLLLKEGADFKSFAEKTRNLYMDRVGKEMKGWGITAYVGYEPVKEIYLHSESGNGLGPLGSMDRVYLLMGIAVFVILLVCINFINLSTARSVYRAREVGLRKVVGSSRAGLIRQFLSESFVLTSLAFVIALAITGVFLPYFNQLLAKNYQLSVLGSTAILGGTCLLVFVITILAGYYPAMVLSALRPTEVLKGKFQTNQRGVQLRRTLVIFQFVISASLIMGTLVVLNQLEHMQKQRLGFNKDEIFVINAARTKSPNPNAFETFRNELEKMAIVDRVGYSNAVPGTNGWPGQVAYAEGKPSEESISVEYMAVDENYLPVLDLELVNGRNFDSQREPDKKDGLVINETAANMFGWGPTEAVGKRIESPSGYPAGEVIGVVKDYHQRGLQQKIGPVVMDYNPGSSYLYSVRYKASDTQQLIEQISTLWKESFPGYDFTYFFLDDNFEKQYQAEERLANIFQLFSGITIIIAAIGLLGLVSFMVVARTKEIGIRKVLGAQVFMIVRLLSKEFIVLVVVANLVSIPITWYLANQWLAGFAYRSTLNLMLFVATFVIAVLVTVLTVGYQTVRAAMADPVKSLRYE